MMKIKKNLIKIKMVLKMNNEEKIYIKRLIHFGITSFGLVIPKKIIENLEINELDILQIYQKDQKIIIEKRKDD